MTKSKPRVALRNLVWLRIFPRRPRHRRVAGRDRDRLAAVSHRLRPASLPDPFARAPLPGDPRRDIVATESERKDPQFVVVDEVLGQWFTLAGALRFDLLTFAMAFALFRLFDIWKPPPIRLIEQIPGGAGIVLDDMMAGAYGALVLFLMGWFNHQ